MPRLRPSTDWPSGRVIRLDHRSEALASNPWEDPAERELAVYLPHGYEQATEPFVALWDLAAYTNAGPGHLNWRNHGENLAQRLDRLIGSGEMDPVVAVIPDCYTSLGGNQYVNSPAVGMYADYLVEELVPLVSAEFNVVDGREGRALFGKSSGGYGALYHAMVYPHTWGAAASHAGDMGFDLLFRRDFPVASAMLSPLKGDIEAFIRSFWRKKRPGGRDFMTMMIIAMAASYDPDPETPEKIRLPFDLRTCEIDGERWANWLAYDPLQMVGDHVEALRSLKGLYIDVGMYDQYNIQFGARRFTDQLNRLGIEHHYEEFEGTHSGIDWRLDHSLPFLANALKSGREEATL
jgi:enterochelin esterase-like enzyme